MLIEYRTNPNFSETEQALIQEMIQGLMHVSQALHGFGMNRLRPGMTEDHSELQDVQLYERDETALLHSAMLTRTMAMMAKHVGDPMSTFYENMARERESLV